MIKGSCLCGGVQFEADCVAMMRHCHCAMCRKQTGAAFGTLALVGPEEFRLRYCQMLWIARSEGPRLGR
jgi:hypothetical protein